MVQVLLYGSTETNTTLDNIFCDDLTDYWDPEDQHPVGYHPTCACQAEETNVRGFPAEMSVSPETNHDMGGQSIHSEKLYDGIDCVWSRAFGV